MLPATAGSLGQGCCRPRLQPGAGPTHVVSWSAVQLARQGGLQAAPLVTPTAAQGADNGQLLSGAPCVSVLHARRQQPPRPPLTEAYIGCRSRRQWRHAPLHPRPPPALQLPAAP